MNIIDYIKYKPPRLRHHAYASLYLPINKEKVKKTSYPEVLESIKWSGLFANGKAPVYLDIGCGMGKLMIELALHQSNVNILGMDVRRNAVAWVNKVIEGEKITNAKAIWYSVVNGIKFIDDKSIKKIFYLFPDPWLKKRHNKRRAFSCFLLDELARVLTDDGKLYLMTDVPEVEEHQLNVIYEHKKFYAEIVSGNQWDLPVMTNQEELCIKKKIPFVKIICRKK